MSRPGQKGVKYERPRDIRFPHGRRGELSYDGTRFPCLIQDISVNGISGICARNLEVSQELEVSFDLTPEHVHRCKIRVQYVEHGCFGAQIIDAAKSEYEVFQEYVTKCFKDLKRL